MCACELVWHGAKEGSTVLAISFMLCSPRGGRCDSVSIVSHRAFYRVQRVLAVTVGGRAAEPGRERLGPGAQDQWYYDATERATTLLSSSSEAPDRVR